LNKEKTFPKITCSCGKTIYKCYLENHLKTKLHKSRLQEIPAVILKSNFLFIWVLVIKLFLEYCKEKNNLKAFTLILTINYSVDCAFGLKVLAMRIQLCMTGPN
jgi:hypothetical protein